MRSFLFIIAFLVAVNSFVPPSGCRLVQQYRRPTKLFVVVEPETTKEKNLWQQIVDYFVNALPSVMVSFLRRIANNNHPPPT
jgi:hypothetical protein